MMALFAAIILAIAAVGGTIVASDSAGPGDALYTIDLAVEDARLTFAFTDEAAASLQAEFAEERLQEAEDAAEEGDAEDAEAALAAFDESIAALEAMLEDDSLSDEAQADLEDMIAALEDMQADVEAGATVDVDIDVEDNGSLAIKLESEDDASDSSESGDDTASETSDPSEGDDSNEVIGVVTFYDGTTITIDGVSYVLGDNIDLGDGTIVGQTVKLEFTTLDDGTLVATEVSIFESSGSDDSSESDDSEDDSSDASEPSDSSD